MAILGITNRSENWKTARYFAPLFGHGSIRLARRLVGADSTFESGQVQETLRRSGSHCELTFALHCMYGIPD